MKMDSWLHAYVSGGIATLNCWYSRVLWLFGTWTAPLFDFEVKSTCKERQRENRQHCTYGRNEIMVFYKRNRFAALFTISIAFVCILLLRFSCFTNSKSDCMFDQNRFVKNRTEICIAAAASDFYRTLSNGEKDEQIKQRKIANRIQTRV